LKIAWFTQVRGDGEIVEYSRRVLAAMVEVCEPRLCCAEPPERFPPAVPVVDLGASPQALWDIGPIDAVFYVLGNDVLQHAWTFEMARAYPGIVVLRDLTLHPFFIDYYLRHLCRPDLYVARMAEHYGLAGLTAAHRILGPSLDPLSARVEDEDLLRYTFTEEALRSASGAVVHSGSHGALVREVWHGPVHEAWLPGAAGRCAETDRSASKYAQELLGFAAQQSADGAVDYFAQIASRAIAERLATQIGQALGSLGAKPGSLGLEAVIAEAGRMLSPPG
jgi:hypothetical protein